MSHSSRCCLGFGAKPLSKASPLSQLSSRRKGRSPSTITKRKSQCCQYMRHVSEVGVYCFQLFAHARLPVLDPRVRQGFLRRNPDDQQLLDARSTLQSYLDTHYPPEQSSPAPPSTSTSHANPLEEMYAEISIPANSESASSCELKLFFGEDPSPPETDPLSWWRNNRARSPQLSRLAFDVLSIPGTMSNCLQPFVCVY